MRSLKGHSDMVILVLQYILVASRFWGWCLDPYHGPSNGRTEKSSEKIKETETCYYASIPKGWLLDGQCMVRGSIKHSLGGAGLGDKFCWVEEPSRPTPEAKTSPAPVLLAFIQPWLMVLQ